MFSKHTTDTVSVQRRGMIWAWENQFNANHNHVEVLTKFMLIFRNVFTYNASGFVQLLANDRVKPTILKMLEWEKCDD